MAIGQIMDPRINSEFIDSITVNDKAGGHELERILFICSHLKTKDPLKMDQKFSLMLGS